MAEDAGIGVGFPQATEQAQQGVFLAGCAGVVGFAVLVESVLRSYGIIAGKDLTLEVLKRKTPSGPYELL